MRRQGRKKTGGEGSKPGLSRRTFLTGSTAVAAAGGVTAAVLGDAIMPEAKSGATDPHQPEYRETEHIRKFYALSRF